MVLTLDLQGIWFVVLLHTPDIYLEIYLECHSCHKNQTKFPADNSRDLPLSYIEYLIFGQGKFCVAEYFLKKFNSN